MKNTRYSNVQAFASLPFKCCLVVSVAGFLLASVGAASAQLAWESTEIYQEQDSEALAFTASFTFENTGEYPLYIQRVRSLDRAARARLVGTRGTVRPGETGKVRVRYANRLLFEEHAVTVEVATDERNSPKTTLALRLAPEGWSEMDEKARKALKAEGERIALMPMPVETSRPTARWIAVPDQPAAGRQSIDVRFVEGQEARVTGLRLLEGQADDFAVRVVEVADGRHYRVEVEPLDRGAVGSRPGRLVYGVWSLETTLSGDALLRSELNGPLIVKAVIVPQIGLAGR